MAFLALASKSPYLNPRGEMCRPCPFRAVPGKAHS